MINEIKYFFQRVFRGWDDRETWDLEYEFLKWILPRLKRLKKISIAYPPHYTVRGWDAFLEGIIARTEKVLLNHQKMAHMNLDEEEEFVKEKSKVVQIIADNLSDFGW